MCSGSSGLVPGHAWHLGALCVKTVVGCAQVVGVWFLAMSGTSELCVLGSVVGCAQVVGVWFLAMPGTSQHCMLDSVVGCSQGVRAQFHRDTHLCLRPSDRVGVNRVATHRLANLYRRSQITF